MSSDKGKDKQDHPPKGPPVQQENPPANEHDAAATGRIRGEPTPIEQHPPSVSTISPNEPPGMVWPTEKEPPRLKEDDPAPEQEPAEDDDYDDPDALEDEIDAAEDDGDISVSKAKAKAKAKRR